MPSRVHDSSTAHARYIKAHDPSTARARTIEGRAVGRVFPHVWRVPGRPRQAFVGVVVSGVALKPGWVA